MSPSNTVIHASWFMFVSLCQSLFFLCLSLALCLYFTLSDCLSVSFSLLTHKQERHRINYIIIAHGNTFFSTIIDMICPVTWKQMVHLCSSEAPKGMFYERH